MIDILNIIAAVLTIAFGLFGFVAPRYTASALDLAPTNSTMGLSEMRASVGGLFVVAGLAAIWIDEPLAYGMIGGHKRARNKRIGPGGGTRRLHQPSLRLGIMGPK